MVASMIAIAVTSLGKRVLEARSKWTAAERRERAQLASLKQDELLALILENRSSEVWAVGAPSLPDSRRIAS